MNTLSKGDSFPSKPIEDCIEKVGRAKYITTFDMLKGYWAVPLTERANNVTAFATANKLYRYKVMAFGVKGASSTYHRLINKVIDGLDDMDSFQDDALLESNTFAQHLAGM